MISHLGAMVSVVNGMLLAHRFQGKKGTVGAASLGEGATSTGACHEALNQAAVERLPLVLVVADNRYAYSTPREKQFACASIIERAAGYGVAGHSVDGTNLAECLRVVGGAVESARGGGGPQLVVADLLRLCGHGEHDDASYVAAKLKCSDVGRDCLDVARERILSEGWLRESELDAIRAKAHEEVEAAVAAASREGAPNPDSENWCALASQRLAEGIE